MLGCLGVWLSEYVIGPKPDMRSEHEPKKNVFYIPYFFVPALVFAPYTKTK